MTLIIQLLCHVTVKANDRDLKFYGLTCDCFSAGILILCQIITDYFKLLKLRDSNEDR